MKNRLMRNTGSGQLRWVILLLAVAVILPTVCLLWFMSQAVQNVQFAARQRLIDVYEEKLTEITQSATRLWQKRVEITQRDAYRLEPVSHFSRFAGGNIRGDAFGDGGLIYDNSGKLLYPIIPTEQVPPELPDDFEKAWQLEFVDTDYSQAIKTYEQIANSTEDDYIWRKAMLGKVRCHRALNEIEEAVKACYKITEKTIPDPNEQYSISLMVQTKILLEDLQFENTPEGTRRRLWLKRLNRVGPLGFASSYNPGSSDFLPMDSATRIFALQEAIKRFEKLKDQLGLPSFYDETKKLLAAEELAAEVANRCPNADTFANWPEAEVRRLDVPGDIYALHYKTTDHTFLLLRRAEGAREEFGKSLQMFTDPDVAFRILDDTGIVVTGHAAPDARPFVTVPLPQPLAAWKAELYLTGSDVFAKAAQRQVNLYLWAGVLVTIMILAAGGLAAQSLSRQIKINRLKNDFIATVSHELKTPLASMRVLADTLLEGNYKDQKQATEYLQLICKENKRLSRLIDNFLTFSRMERNKQAFEIVETSPAAIAKAAAEAVKTKFDKPKCEFKVNIREDLPDLLADHDAMVTVIVNLLDNAYKYSYDEKRIELGVYSDDGSVCFRVSDNGIGLSQRSIKKIFKRFYQVDRSLSRRVEGCGLGLSIAMFIVDAHKGSISVDSIPGERSTFTVRLPVAN